MDKSTKLTFVITAFGLMLILASLWVHFLQEVWYVPLLPGVVFFLIGMMFMAGKALD